MKIIYNIKNKILCDYPFTHFEINNPNGDVTFCCNHNMVLGNVNNNTIEEIWNSEKYQEVRRKFLDGKIFEICDKSCPVLNGWKDYEKLDWYKKLPPDSEVYQNAALNDKEISEGKFLLESKPRWIRFASSYRCNLKCYHCFQEENRNEQKKLPENFYRNLYNYFSTLQVLFFYGGEPLIEKENIHLLEYISRNNFLLKLFIVTNGLLFNYKIKEIFNLINIGVIAISLDSCSKKLYEELRYPGKWDDLILNLEYISVLKKKKDFLFNVGFTLNKKNIFELVDFIKFSKKFNAFPGMQFAGNTFSKPEFRNKYEIYSKKDFEIANNKISEAKQFLNAEYANVPDYVKKNFEYMADYSKKMITERTFWNIIIQKAKRKINIYKNKISNFLTVGIYD